MEAKAELLGLLQYMKQRDQARQTLRQEENESMRTRAHTRTHRHTRTYKHTRARIHTHKRAQTHINTR